MVDEAKTAFQRFVGEALSALPKTRNYYDRQIQDRLNTTGKPLYDIERRGHAPKRETLKAIAEVLGQPFELVQQAVDGEHVDPVPPASQSQSQSLRLLGSIDKTPDRAPTHDASGGEIVQIIQLDLSLPMGPGATIDEYVEEQQLDFDLAYIRSFTRTPPNRLRLARGIGESMYPTLNNMDLVWIDSTQRQLNQSDRVWAVSINGAAAIKRLRPMKGGRVLVMSDNPAIGDYEVDADELLIGGRVIRFARDL